ncbi:MAG: hypothetical protein RL076_142 [Chloroflexota bacterium]
MNVRVAKQTTIVVLALVCALLTVRLIVLLFAARPDNSSLSFILNISDVLVWPLAWLDATQPQFGARFERGTLLMVVLGILGLRFVHKMR